MPTRSSCPSRHANTGALRVPWRNGRTRRPAQCFMPFRPVNKPRRRTGFRRRGPAKRRRRGSRFIFYHQPVTICQSRPDTPGCLAWRMSDGKHRLPFPEHHAGAHPGCRTDEGAARARISAWCRCSDELSEGSGFGIGTRIQEPGSGFGVPRKEPSRRGNSPARQDDPSGGQQPRCRGLFLRDASPMGETQTHARPVTARCAGTACRNRFSDPGLFSESR